MARKSLAEMNCSWAQAAEAIGDKWSIMILRDAYFGIKTFSAFEKSLGISKNILTQRLQHLQSHGILEKSPVGLGTTRSEYSLTAKGRALLPAMLALAQWSDAWVFGAGENPFRYVDRSKLEDLPKLCVTAADGRILELDDVTVLAGPGANDANKQVIADRKKFESNH